MKKDGAFKRFLSRYKNLLRLLFGLGLLTIILFNLSIPSVINRLSGLVWIFVIASIFIEILARIIASLKWFLILQLQDQSIRFIQTVVAQFVGIFIGSIIPVFGVDLGVGYAYYLQSGRMTTAVSSVLTDRFVSLYATVLFVLTVFILNLNYFSNRAEFASSIAVISLGALLFPIILILLIRIPRFQKSKLIPITITKLTNSVFSDFLDYYKRGSWILVYNFFLTLGIQLLRVLFLYTIVLSVGFSPSFLESMVIAPILFLLIMLPVPLAWLGWEQGIFIVMLGFMGISAEDAFVIALVNRLSYTATFLPGVFSVLTGRGLENLEQRSASDAKINKEPPEIPFLTREGMIQLKNRITLH